MYLKPFRYTVPTMALSCLLAASSVFGQTYTKSFKIPGSGIRANSGKLLSDGNMLIAGTSSPVVQDRALQLVKVSAGTGDTVWSRSLRMAGKFLSAPSIEEMGNGDIVAACIQTDSNSIVDTPKMLLLSLDHLGNTNWSKYYIDPVHYPRFARPLVKKISPVSFLACSTSQDTIGTVVTKFNLAGDTLFSKAVLLDSLYTNNDFRISDVLNITDGYLFTGVVRYSEFEEHSLLFKTDTSGNLLWIKSDGHPLASGLGTGYSLSAQQMIMTPDSNIVVSVLSGAGFGLVKMTRTGVVNWVNVANDTTTYGTYPAYGYLASANDGGYYIAGFTDAPAQNISNFRAVGRQLIFKFDSVGNVNWAKTYEFEKNYNNCAFIAQLTSGDLLCAGTIYDTITAAPVNSGKFYAMRLDGSGNSAGAGCGTDSAYLYYTTTPPFVFASVPHHYCQGYGFGLRDVTNDLNAPVVSDAVPVKAVALFVSPATSVCQGSTVWLTAVPANGGTAINYEFKVNGVSVQNGPSATYVTSALVYPDVVTCVMSSTGSCGTTDTVFSNPLTPNIYPTATPSVTVNAAPGSTVTPGTSVTFSVTVVNQGPTPSYMWKKNGVSITSFPTYTTSTLATGDIISCNVTNSSLCSAAPTGTGQVTMVVAPVDVAELTASKFQVVPNPASKFISITGNELAGKQLMINDIAGRCVLSAVLGQTSQTINIEDLGAGLYFVQITDGNYREVKKLTIVR